MPITPENIKKLYDEIISLKTLLNEQSERLERIEGYVEYNYIMGDQKEE